MNADTIRTYAEIGSAVGTLALAIVTYLTLREMRKEKTANIKIDLDTGLSEKILGYDQYGDATKKDAQVIIFKALNIGRRAVSLEKFELWLDNVEKLDIPICIIGPF